MVKQVDSRIVDALRLSALAVAFIVAAFAMVQYLRYSGRPDAAEMRDLGLLIAMELALVPLALTFLVRRGSVEPMVAEPLPRGTSVPNPWSY